MLMSKYQSIILYVFFFFLNVRGIDLSSFYSKSGMFLFDIFSDVTKGSNRCLQQLQLGCSDENIHSYNGGLEGIGHQK